MNSEQPNESRAMLVNALLRYLLCISPWRAEAVYYSATMAPPLKDGGWTQVTAGGRSGWIFVDGRAGTGRYRSSPPPDVPPGTIRAIEIPPAYRIGLRTKAETLVAQAGGAAAHPALANLLPRLLAMGDGSFEGAEIARFLRQCSSPGWLHGGLPAYRDELLRGLCEARCPGYFVGLMLLLLKVIEDAGAVVMAAVLLSPQRAAHLNALLHVTLRNVLANDGPGSIERAAAELRGEGRALLAAARQSTRDEAFYGQLFQACPRFYAAKQAFELLAAATPGDARKEYERADHACEEYLVYCSSSLLNRFENLHGGWQRWRQHGQHVLQVRKASGDAAAERQAAHYLDPCVFYPESWRAALLRGGKPPPETPGTAGGACMGALCGGAAASSPAPMGA